MNFVEVIRTETRAFADKTALIDGNILLTYRELFLSVDAVSDELRRAGVAAGDRVALLCDDNADYVVAALGILCAGGVVVPVSPAQTEEERLDIIETIDVHFLLASLSIKGSPGGFRIGQSTFRTGEFDLSRRQTHLRLPPAYSELEPAFIRFSSGTTGRSKGVLLSHSTIDGRTLAADKGLGITSDDVVLWVLSMSFHFVVTILLFLRRGATIVICHQTFPVSFMEGVTRNRGTFMYASPFHYHVISRTDLIPRRSLSAVRMAVSTAMELPASVAGAFAEKFGFPLTGAYGIIEVGLPFVDADPSSARPGSVGRVLPDFEATLSHPDENGVGEILVRGRGLFDAYFSPWRTSAQVMKDGWFQTGDLGRFDPDGRLFIVGRQKDVINFAGMKIFPYEIEAVLNRYPLIQESMVFGKQDGQYGNLPCAKLVLAPGADSLDPADVRKFCFRHLAAYKVPKEFEIVAGLERTASRKLKRG